MSEPGSPAVPGVPGAVDPSGVIDAVPPEVPGERRVVEVVTTYLEMRSPPVAPVAASPPGTRVIRVAPTAPTRIRFYRSLYDGVGAAYHWYARRLMSDAELDVVIADPAVEVHVLWKDGAPAGFAELDRRQAGEVELAYFGLLPEAVGQRLGPWLLAWAVATAWAEPSVGRVWVHTCSLDHPSALPCYERAGFQRAGQSRHRQTIV